MDDGGDGSVTAGTTSALAVIRLNDVVLGGRQCKNIVFAMQHFRNHKCYVRVCLKLLGRLEDPKQGGKQMDPPGGQQLELMCCPGLAQHQVPATARAAAVDQMQHQGQCLDWRRLVTGS